MPRGRCNSARFARPARRRSNLCCSRSIRRRSALRRGLLRRGDDPAGLPFPLRHGGQVLRLRRLQQLRPAQQFFRILRESLHHFELASEHKKRHRLALRQRPQQLQQLVARIRLVSHGSIQQVKQDDGPTALRRLRGTVGKGVRRRPRLLKSRPIAPPSSLRERRGAWVSNATIDCDLPSCCT